MAALQVALNGAHPACGGTALWYKELDAKSRWIAGPLSLI
jgi:hypothetical protein